MNKDKSILVVVPAYNEQDNIAQVIAEIKLYQPNADILVVNDCSTDETSRIARLQSNIKVIDLPRNIGIGGTMQTGFMYAMAHNYDYMLQVDGDGQHMPIEIATLIQAIESSHHDMIIGSRFLGVRSDSTTFMRKCGIKVFYYLFKILINVSITDSTSGFRIFNKKSIKVLSKYYPEDYPEPDAVIILHKHGLTTGEVGVKMRARIHGTSSITPIRSPYYMIKVINSILFTHIRTRW